MARRKAIEPGNDAGSDTETAIATDTATDFDPAQLEAESAAATEKKPFNPIRSWSSRLVQPVKYNISTDANLFVQGASQRGAIVIKFFLPNDQRTPDGAVLEVMQSHKKGYGGKPTGLKFMQTREHGPVWVIPNDYEGRALADKIEQGLVNVAEKMEANERSR